MKYFVVCTLLLMSGTGWCFRMNAETGLVLNQDVDFQFKFRPRSVPTPILDGDAVNKKYGKGKEGKTAMSCRYVDAGSGGASCCMSTPDSNAVCTTTAVCGDPISCVVYGRGPGAVTAGGVSDSTKLHMKVTVDGSTSGGLGQAVLEAPNATMIENGLFQLSVNAHRAGQGTYDLVYHGAPLTAVSPLTMTVEAGDPVISGSESLACVGNGCILSGLRDACGNGPPVLDTLSLSISGPDSPSSTYVGEASSGNVLFSFSLTVVGTYTISAYAGSDVLGTPQEVIVDPKGKTSSNPATSCKEALASHQAQSMPAPSGSYWIMVQSVAREVFCDMETRGGGWTMCIKYNGNAAGSRWLPNGSGRSNVGCCVLEKKGKNENVQILVSEMKDLTTSSGRVASIDCRDVLNVSSATYWMHVAANTGSTSPPYSKIRFTEISPAVLTAGAVDLFDTTKGVSGNTGAVANYMKTWDANWADVGYSDGGSDLRDRAGFANAVTGFNLDCSGAYYCIGNAAVISGCCCGTGDDTVLWSWLDDTHGACAGDSIGTGCYGVAYNWDFSYLFAR